MKLYNGDCLDVMDKLIEEGVKVDAIITDPPYGTTACKWDQVIPFDEMWPRLKALRKDRAAVVLFGSEPFSSLLRVSNLKEFKYDWVWVKNRSTGHVHAKNRPMKKHEMISIFSNGITIHEGQSPMRMVYYPQGLSVLPPGTKRRTRNDAGDNAVMGARPSHRETIATHTGYPTSIVECAIETHKDRYHTTQKPVALIEYFVKTYTQPGETVLDFTMGSGTTGVACKNTGRDFIGIELGAEYFQIAKQRIESIQPRLI